MKNLLLAFFAFIMSSAYVFAQDAPNSKWNITDVSLLTGTNFNENTLTSIEDFQKLHPNSSMLQTDFSPFRESMNNRNINGSASFSALIGINRRYDGEEKKMFNPEFRFGISYSAASLLQISYFKENTIPFDTLTSSSSGAMLYLDSVYTNTYYMNYNADQLKADVSCIFRTSYEKRWSLFGGAGVQVGINYNARTIISNVQYARVRSSDNNYYSSSQNYSDFQQEQEGHSNANGGVFASAYLPMGIDFRIGKKSEFWKSIHLFNEFRPSISFTRIPELRTLVNASFATNLGIRYTIH